MSGLVGQRGVWKRFWSGVAQFAQRAGGQAPTANAAMHSSPDVDRGLSFEDFARRLKETSSFRPGVPLGAVHILNLAKLKARFGAEWPKMAGKIDKIARRVIEQKLGPLDLYTSFPGPTYLMVFGSLSTETAKFKAALIAAEIEKRFLGEEAAIQDLQIGVAVAELGPGMKVENISPQELLGNLLAGQLASGGSPGSRWHEERAGISSDPNWEAAKIGDDDDPTRRWKIIESAYEDVDMHDIGFIYRPIWHVRRQALSLYHCIPVPMDPKHGPLLDQPLVLDPAAANSLDRLVLDRVLEDVRAACEDGRRAMIGFPLHFHSLADLRRRQKISTGLERLDEFKSSLVCEIVGVPEGTPGQRLYDAVAAIVPHVRMVNLRSSVGRVDFSGLIGVRIYAVGVEAPFMGRETAFVKASQRFAEAANRAGLRTYVHGVRSLSLTTSLIGAGFDFVDGDAVATLVSSPKTVYKFGAIDLYRPLIKLSKRSTRSNVRTLGQGAS